jgi:ubiquinone/menaquinone biosynthesis C-methylase UbiE
MRRVADLLDTVPDAFLPELLRGQLVEAEHLARYWWVAQGVAGLRVLDAGCGVGHGSLILAQAGARKVVGIDSAPALLEAGPPEPHSAIDLVEMDARTLAFPDHHFEMVVALGLLDQVNDRESTLPELLRVLDPGGSIAVSVQAGAEKPSSEDIEGLRALMRSGGCEVRVVRQHNWMTSSIFEEERYASADSRQIDDADLRKLVAASEDSEISILLFGSRAEPPAMRGMCVMTHAFAHRRWLARSNALEEQVAKCLALEEKLRDALLQRDEIAQRLVELERRLARAFDE